MSKDKARAENNDIQDRNAPVVIESVGEDIPQGFQKGIESLMLSMYSEQKVVSSASKIAEKLTPDHITKIIENADREDVRSYSAFKMSKLMAIVYLVISLGFASFLLVFFRDSEHFITILAAIFSFLGGLGVGKYIIPTKK